MSKHVGV